MENILLLSIISRPVFTKLFLPILYILHSILCSEKGLDFSFKIIRFITAKSTGFSHL